MKALIIGFGNIAENSHLKIFEEFGIEAKACVDICCERRKKAEKFGIKAYADLESVEGDFDFADITTPPNFRYEPICFAAENQLPIICEKPLSLPSEIEMIENIISESNAFIFPIHNWKHAPQYVITKEVVSKSRADEIKIKVLRTSPAKGCAEWEPEWRRMSEYSGGGIIVDHGYHNIYLSMFIFDAKIEREKIKKISWFNGLQVDMESEFELELENGVEKKKSEIYLSWNADKREITCEGFKSGEKIFEMRENELVFDGQKYSFAMPLSADSLHIPWTRNSVAEFLNAIERKDKRTLSEGIDVVKTISRIYAQASLLR